MAHRNPGPGSASRQSRPAADTGGGPQALRDTPRASDHYYVQIPGQLWTSGYVARLCASGLAFYLILLDQQWMSTAPEAVWFSPRILKERYALSEDTRTKGMNDLRELGLITVRRQPVNPDDFDLQRVRNTYTLNPDALDHLPPPPLASPRPGHGQDSRERADHPPA